MSKKSRAQARPRPALLVSLFLPSCTTPAPEARTPAEQCAVIAGAWRTGEDTGGYLWHFLNDHSFSNERGSRGTWNCRDGEFTAVATNQGSNATTWRMRPSADGGMLNAVWSDPSGNHGTLTLVRK